MRPGGQARFAVWVWITKGSGASATIKLSVKPARLTPHFTVCQPTGGKTCSVSGLTAGQRIELQARVAVPTHSAPAKVVLTASSSKLHGAIGPATDSGSLPVEVQPKTSPTPPVPTPPDPFGGLPPGEGLPPGLTGPGGSLPGLPTPATGDAGSSFPSLLPSPSPSPGSAPPHSIHLTDVSAGFPLSMRLIGGQLVGLAILAAAVTIALARLSLRKPRVRPAAATAGVGGSTDAARPADTGPAKATADPAGKATPGTPNAAPGPPPPASSPPAGGTGPANPA